MNWAGAGTRFWMRSTHRRRSAFELHPGEDLHDGITFERFLDAVSGHGRRISSTTRAISFCRRSTISRLSTSIMSASKPFM